MRSRRATIGMVIVGLALLLLVGCTGGGGTSKYAVSGTVTGVDGNGIKGVALSFEGFGTADTDEDGKWRKDGLSGTVKVSPTKDGWAFEPSSRTVSKADSSVNFVATKLEYPLIIQVQGEGTVNQEVLVVAQGTEYEHGTQVQLTAVPATGWRFSHWEGDLDGNENPATIMVDSEKSVTAVFVILEYALNLTVEGEGTVNQEVLVAAQGTEYEHGTQVQITAVPATGWRFSHWKGDLEGSANPTTILVDREKSVTAVFEKVFWGVSLEKVGSGSISVVPEQESYRHGDTVTFTAVADEEWIFSHWVGVDADKDNPLVMVITEHLNLTGVFIPSYSLELNVEGEGTIDANPEQDRYAQDSMVELHAIPKDGWSFVKWGGDIDGASPTISIEMHSNKSVKAIFEPEEYTLNLEIKGQGTLSATPEQDFYYWGDEVLLVANPADGWYLEGWSDATTNELTRTITMAGDRLITVNFRPIEEGFTTSFYGSITIGSRVHQMPFSITNRLPFGVGLSKVQVRNQNGSVMAESSEPDLLNNNYLAPNASVELSISPVLPPYVTDAERWEVHWHLVVNGQEYVIISKYRSSWW